MFIIRLEQDLGREKFLIRLAWGVGATGGRGGGREAGGGSRHGLGRVGGLQPGGGGRRAVGGVSGRAVAGWGLIQWPTGRALQNYATHLQQEPIYIGLVA